MAPKWTMVVLSEYRQATTYELSFGTVIFDLKWPWTLLDVGHGIFTSPVCLQRRVELVV